VVRVFYCLNFWPGQMDRGEQLRPPNFCSDGTRVIPIAIGTGRISRCPNF